LLLHPAAEQTSKGALLPWLKRLDHGLRKVGLRQGWIGSTKITYRIPVNTVANRSISISLEEELLAQLDAQGSNRSALVSQALSEWLARRRIDALNTAYAHLASLEAGDLADAGEAAVAMGEEALAAASDG
jgi:post-segregation antitoxin (ccd killing protein)